MVLCVLDDTLVFLLEWLLYSRDQYLFIGELLKDFRYLPWTSNFMLCYYGEDPHLIGFSASDWASDQDVHIYVNLRLLNKIDLFTEIVLKQIVHLSMSVFRKKSIKRRLIYGVTRSILVFFYTRCSQNTKPGHQQYKRQLVKEIISAPICYRVNKLFQFIVIVQQFLQILRILNIMVEQTYWYSVSLHTTSKQGITDEKTSKGSHPPMQIPLRNFLCNSLSASCLFVFIL